MYSGQLSVQRDGADVQNNTFIEIANTRSGPLPLRCGDSGGNVTWLILPDNGSSLLIYDGTSKGDNVYAIVGSGSQIELTIQNNVEPFRGLLKCVSTSGGVLNIQVVPRGELDLQLLRYICLHICTIVCRDNAHLQANT